MIASMAGEPHAAQPLCELGVVGKSALPRVYPTASTWLSLQHTYLISLEEEMPHSELDTSKIFFARWVDNIPAVT